MDTVLSPSVFTPPAPGSALAEMVFEATTSWSNDAILLDAESNGHALLLLGEAIFERHGLVEACALDRQKVRSFFAELGARYGRGQYHNAIHGADVMLSTHLFVTEFGLVERLTKLQLFALLLGAVVHDYNHPGTSNAHEVKMRTKLAMIYSDQSVLEQHHLASAFAVIHSHGTDVLSGLKAEEYAEVRSLVIEMVLHTDLSKHFDFIARLKTLASSKGHAAHVAAVQKAKEVALSKQQSSKATHLQAPTRQGNATGSRRGAEDGGGGDGPTSPDSKGGGKPELSGSSRENAAGAGTKRRMSIGNLLRPGDGSTAELQVAAPPVWQCSFLTDEVDVRLLITTAIKFADLGHSFKPFHLHEQWTTRITNEFWEVGDREKSVGVPISPLCDREKDRNIPQSQLGFFQFVCIPYFKVVADLIDPKMVPYTQLEANFKEWQSRKEHTAQLTMKAVAASKGEDAPPSPGKAPSSEDDGAAPKSS